MKAKKQYTFETNDLGDKFKMVLLVNGKKEQTLYKSKNNESVFVSLKELQDQLIANYLISEDEGEL